ncbi:ATP-binding transport protein NatA [Geobacter sp. OR-1]|uniref:ABC transporter ATP-binding protein n=1 Tax=Geobacter sp. OR-1 TaxID=1266765 RepID=UPI000543AD2E|nr:ABC transporter ATP-binding protein [Geobacter sp. OR-1]GAM10212.1 ATP-binding transport protein NatA [Geobacter sp. OR-1]
MIQIENLTKRFGQHVAVNGISFTVGRGETMGLLGPNGAGKTTMMRMITGYLPPNDGRVVIDGLDMFDQPSEVKKRIGYLPEQPPVYMDLTVREYLEFAARIRALPGNRVKRQIELVVERCGISDKLGRLIGNLSKGYRQRVGLAQALVHNPDILILDEPTVGLDPVQIVEIRELVRELGRERTVILSSHIMQEITTICEKVAIINQGKLVAFDSIANLSSAMSGGQRLTAIVSRPGNVDRARLLSLPHLLSVESRPDGYLDILGERGWDVREPLARELYEMDSGLLELRLVSLTLEEVFLKAITS